MTAVTLEANDKTFDAARRLLDPRQLEQAIYQVVTRTARKMNVQVKDKLGDELPTILRKYINAAVSTKITIGDGEAVGVTSVAYQPLPMIAFHPHATKKGGVTVDFGQGPLTFRHLFKARMPHLQKNEAGLIIDASEGGHVGIFGRVKGTAGFMQKDVHPGRFTPLYERSSEKQYDDKLLIQLPRGSRNVAFRRGTASGYVWRLPIKEAAGPTPFSVANEPEVADAINIDVRAELDRQMEGQIRRFLKLKSDEPIPETPGGAVTVGDNEGE